MQEIADWLTRLGLPEYARAFAENGIDVSVLPHFTDPWRIVAEPPMQRSTNKATLPSAGRAKISLPNQRDGRSQGQLRASNGTRSPGRIGQPNRARAAPVHRYSRTEP